MEQGGFECRRCGVWPCLLPSRFSDGLQARLWNEITMSKELLGIIFLPLGVLSMCMAALWQVYVMMSESYTLNRFKDKQLLWRVVLLFFSFSLAVYWLCPNARKKGIVFLLLGVGGAVMYVLAGMWLPFNR